MVGGASLGCRTCKRRRIKCDERRPICFNSERSKRFCSGAEDRFKYHYGCMRQRDQLVAALQSSEHPPHATNIVYTAIKDGSGQLQSLHWVKRPFSKVLQNTPTPTDVDRLRASLVQVLEYPNPCFPLQTLGPYVTTLPERLVRALQKEIARSKQRLSVEVLCAALLIAKYEFYLRKPSYAIVTLAGGVTSILKSWGPSEFYEKFELAMFSSHLPTIIIHSILFGGDRFLENGIWEDMIQQCNGSGTLASKLWLVMARIAGWLHDVRSTNCHSSAHSRVVVERGLGLKEQVRELLEDATVALNFADICHLIPPLYTGMMPVLEPPPEEERNAHRIIEHASYTCTALVMVNGALKRLRADGVYEEESQRATSFILAALPAADTDDHLYFNFVGPAAFGLADKVGRRVIVETMHRSLISHLRLSDKADSSELYEVLCGRLDAIHAAMTGGPILLRMHAE